jgi:xanthine/uracil permease
VLGFQDETATMANAVIVGLLLLGIALGAIFAPQAWEEWSELVLGLWLIASPWVLAFSGNQDARVNAVIVGLIVAVLALWVLVTDKDYSGWWRNAAQ